MCPRKKIFFDAENVPKLVPNTVGKIKTPGAKSLNHYLKCSDKNFLNFIEGCLQWDADDRMTSGEALVHDWILEGLPPEIRT
jgi:dual specificity tyrosine-phosphorylation-regulated kinase 2/3/4